MSGQYETFIQAARDLLAGDNGTDQMRALATELVAWADGERPNLLYREAEAILRALAAATILEAAREMSITIATSTIPPPESPRPH